jgi:flagellar basal-body rod protein FlgB
MAMANDMSIISYLEAGIKNEAVRQSAIAGNIANLETPGYRRVDVKFNDVLTKKIADNEMLTDDEAKSELFVPQKTPLAPNGNDVSFDSEVGELVKNSIRHKAYTRILAKTYQQYDMAMNFSR